jgi:hypothetical protein
LPSESIVLQVVESAAFLQAVQMIQIVQIVSYNLDKHPGVQELTSVGFGPFAVLASQYRVFPIVRTRTLGEVDIEKRVLVTGMIFDTVKQ